MIKAKVIADSMTPNKVRLVTLQLCYPRFIHSELMTHRVFSRNAASSRAIPIQKMIEQVSLNPAKPVFWGKNQSGMQAKEELEYYEPYECWPSQESGEPEFQYSPREQAQLIWEDAAQSAINHVKQLMALGLHKQIANRLLEPWQEMQTIVTSTEWDNFYALRRHPDAQPEIKVLADQMYEAMQQSTPKELLHGQWHLPYVDDASIIFGGGLTATLAELKKWSTARCARVSYLTHDKENPDPVKDEDLHDKLLQSGHFSPFEHIATPGEPYKMYANFREWRSYRHQLGF